LDRRVAEIDPENDRVVGNVAGGHTFHVAHAIAHDIVTNDRAVAIIEGNTSAIVQHGGGVHHHVVLHQCILAYIDPDIADVVQAITADDGAISCRTDRPITPDVLSHAGTYRDIVVGVVLDQYAGIVNIHGRGEGVMEVVPDVEVVGA